MWKLKDKKTKWIIIIFITLITVLEIYFVFKIRKTYKGVYRIAIFVPFIIFQPFLCEKFLKRQKQILNYKTRIIIMCTIVICLPLTIYLTLPRYTYGEGKQIVKQKMEPSKKEALVDYPFDQCTIDVGNNPKQIFVLNKEYYYKISSTEGNKYYIVNPLTGKVDQLAQDFWQNLKK